MNSQLTVSTADTTKRFLSRTATAGYMALAALLLPSLPAAAESKNKPEHEPLYFAFSPGHFFASDVRDGKAQSVSLQAIVGLPSLKYDDVSYEFTLFGTSLEREQQQDPGSDSVLGFDLSYIKHYAARHATFSPFSAIGIGATLEDIQDDRDGHLSLSLGGGFHYALAGYSKLRTDIRGLVTRNDIDEQGSRFLVDGRVHVGLQFAIGRTYGNDPLMQ